MGMVRAAGAARRVTELARRVARSGRFLYRNDPPQLHATESTSTEDADSAHLSPAEERALRLYAQGYSTMEVAERMDVGYETAKTYLRRVREKYARAGRPASRKSELIRRAAEDGLLE